MVHRPLQLLVTGGAGFIGSHFVRYWLENYPDSSVINLDLLTYASSPAALATVTTNPGYRFVQGDINDQALIARLFEEHAIDTVVHFAAESHVDRSISGPAAFVQTNLVGTFTLLEAARQAWAGRDKVRFHHISTDEVYGTLGREEAPFTELTPYQPNSPYSASKAGSDHLVRAYHHTYDLPVTTTNCSNNYGPWQHGEKFIPTVIRACREQRPIPVYGDGSNIRDWLFVGDHCRGIDTVIRNGREGETYNIGGDNELSNLQIVEAICRLFDERFPDHAPHNQLISFVTDRPGHDWRYAIDASKIRRELDWQAQESFTSGLAITVNWYLAQLEAGL